MMSPFLPTDIQTAMAIFSYTMNDMICCKLLFLSSFHALFSHQNMFSTPFFSSGSVPDAVKSFPPNYSFAVV